MLNNLLIIVPGDYFTSGARMRQRNALFVYVYVSALRSSKHAFIRPKFYFLTT